MAEKVLRLHPSRGFFLDAGLHLANPEKPVVILHESYVPPKKVVIAIQHGTLIDVNHNVLVTESEQAPEAKKAPVQQEVHVEEVEDASEDAEDEKPKAKAKSKTRR